MFVITIYLFISSKIITPNIIVGALHKSLTTTAIIKRNAFWVSTGRSGRQVERTKCYYVLCYLLYYIFNYIVFKKDAKHQN